MIQSPGKRWEEWENLRKENQELRAAIKKWRAEYEHLRKYVESQAVLPSAYPPRSVIREISQSVSPKRKPSLSAKPQNNVVNPFQDIKDSESKPHTTISPQPNLQNMVTRARPKNYPVENLGRDDAIKVSFNHITPILFCHGRTKTKVDQQYRQILRSIRQFAEDLLSPFLSNPKEARDIVKTAQNMPYNVKELRRYFSDNPDLARATYERNVDVDITEAIIYRFVMEHIFLDENHPPCFASRAQIGSLPPI